jgi:tripartite-type tricarboxylate transporter receptor subunit TctC
MRRRALLALLPTPALAQGGYPSRPVRLVIPFTTGGSNDIIGRILAEGMAARLGQPVIVENRGGAGGILGNDVVAKAAPDGQTVLLAGSGSFVISGLVAARLPMTWSATSPPSGCWAHRPTSSRPIRGSASATWPGCGGRRRR